MSDAKAISVLGICGSLRQASFNRAALNTAIEVRPPEVEVTVADISQIPLYNEDVRAQDFPPPVETLRQQIKAADALLFACPEYNYSMSGVLKNAIDWASRPAFQSVLAYKPVAIMTTSRGPLGGARCLEHLRTALDSCLSRIALAREVIITAAETKIKDGRLVDEISLGFACGAVEALLKEIALWKATEQQK
jgi:chromate reductase, NAD(P)H dehydrogenase (quinone)